MKICDQPVNYLLNVFKTTFISVAENHAPIIQKRVRGIDSCPLLDSSIKMQLNNEIICIKSHVKQQTLRTGRTIVALEIGLIT